MKAEFFKKCLLAMGLSSALSAAMTTSASWSRNLSSGTPKAGLAITLDQVVRGFTLRRAEYLDFPRDQKLGSIGAEKIADFVVLVRNVVGFARRWRY